MYNYYIVTEMENNLLQAIKWGTLNDVARLIDGGADVNQVSKDHPQ